MKKFIFIIILVFFNYALFSIIPIESKQKPKAEYLGSEVCKPCHSSEAIGDQFSLWLRSPHSQAVTILKSETARQIAKTVSVVEPARDLQCLRCHTTGGGKTDATRTEGVGCEACHGPGSLYHQASNHVDYIDKKLAYMKAIRLGMYPVLDIVDEHLKNREKLCLHCHNEKRPCLPVDPQKRQFQKLSIQTIEKMMKGDINLRHKLRR